MINEEQYDKLPFRESRKEYITRVHYNMYNLKRFDYYVNPFWKIVHRVLENNIGKSFDLAFSYYCKQVPKYCQHMFLDEFQPRYRRHSRTWYVDDYGNIQYDAEVKYKRTYTVKTANYREGYWDTIFKREISNREFSRSVQFKIFYSKKTSNRYIRVILEGKEYVFKSKDYRYKRVFEDERKKKESIRRKNKKHNELYYQSLLYWTTFERKNEEKQVNLQKIESHGFDPVMSFRSDRN